MRPLLISAMVLAPLFFSGAAPAVSTTVVISEFRARGPNGANDEFIELFNKSNAPVVVTGWRIVVSDSAGNTSVLRQLGTVTIPAGRFYLLANNGTQGYSGTVAPNATYTVGIPDDGGFALQNTASVVIDEVGMSAGSAHKEGTPLAPIATNGNQSYERNDGGCSPSQDTDDNATDFRFNSTRSFPQNSGTVCNPCQGVQCQAPPNAQCWLSTGTCSQGLCTYPQRPAGAPCNDGDPCTSGDTCDAAAACTSGAPNPCASPPDPFCSDPQTSVTFAEQGTCSSPSGCTYAQDPPTACPFGCNGNTGLCRPDPCTNVACNTPPPSGCYLPTGACVSGSCVYTTQPANTPCSDGNGCTLADTCDAGGNCVSGTPSVVDDGNPCTADACAPGTGQVSHTPVANGTNCDDGDACNGIATCQAGLCANGTPVTCDSPPLGGCYEPGGTCNPASGACSYGFSPQGDVCDDGSACTAGDQCDGNGACNGSTVICTPPVPVCEDAVTSRSFSGGVCSPTTGACTFTPTDTTCTFGCNATAGLCNQDPCIGVTCTVPPSTCDVTPGSCSGGVCSYPLKPGGAACDDGNPCTTVDECSAGGACSGTPLLCNAPPLPICVDPDTSRTFDSNGTCSGGVCDYAFSDSPCPLGCSLLTGLCQGDPCAGVNCDSPPSQCDQAVGVCSGGTCTYAPKPAGSSCDDGDVCTDGDVCSLTGACAGSPTTCNSPPASSCTDASTSRVYDVAGTCVALGSGCTYTFVDTACANGCDAPSGVCAGDPCAGIVCETAPGPCFLSTGSCAAGTCSYPPRPTGVTCDDNDPCTIGDACDGAGVCSGAPNPSCGDGGVPEGGLDGGAGGDGAIGVDGSAGRDSGGDGSAGRDAGGDGEARPDSALDGGVEASTGGADGGVAGAAGSGGAAGGSAAGGRPGSSGSSGDGGEAPGTGAKVEGGGCGCSVPGETSRTGWPLALLVASTLLLRRRRRPQSPNRTR